MSEFCIICLKNNENLKNINENDKSNTRIIIKLRKCVPEVEWKNDCICPNCLDKLELVCAFRDLCIQSYLANKSSEKELKSESFDKLLLDDNNCEANNELIGNKIKVEASFVCFHCGRSFKLKNSLANHIKTEHNSRKCSRRKKQFACTTCGKFYTTLSVLKKHSSICRRKEEIEEKDEKTKTSPEQDDIKIELTADKQENICDICGTYFTNKYLLKRHSRNVHATEKKFKCELCERKFASPVYLNAHKRYHTGERKHICSFCGKGYITASDLYHHEKIHANKRAYRCEKCPKAFNTSSDLHKHKICVHMDRALWKYECSYCQRKFPLKTNLDTHTKTHTGERNFLCHLCDRKCINRSVLKRHIESHSNVKAFKCNLCFLGYKYQKSLDLHLTKIHGLGNAKIPERVKKYFCNICPKSYFANNKLQKHIRSHTGERPFHCTVCTKSFIDKSYVKQHCKMAHGGDVGSSSNVVVGTTF